MGREGDRSHWEGMLGYSPDSEERRKGATKGHRRIRTNYLPVGILQNHRGRRWEGERTVPSRRSCIAKLKNLEKGKKKRGNVIAVIGEGGN